MQGWEFAVCFRWWNVALVNKNIKRLGILWMMKAPWKCVNKICFFTSIIRHEKYSMRISLWCLKYNLCRILSSKCIYSYSCQKFNSWNLPVKLLMAHSIITLMINQHWIRKSLCVVRQQAIVWASVGVDLFRHIASLGFFVGSRVTDNKTIFDTAAS